MCIATIAGGVIVLRRKRLEVEDCAPVYPDLDNSLALDDQSLRAAPKIDYASDPVVDVGPEKDFDGNELKDVEFI